MDNENKQNDENNISTQKTVRLKPLVKQPMVGDNSTESQSVKKVSTNSGAFPKVGTQTGRISSIATNTARVVKINSSLRSSIGSNASGPNTTMMDFRTSEIQMASSNQNSPATTRPAGAPKSVLNSLNLKPKVAEASVVEPSAASAPTVAAIVPENNDDTKTAAVPKAPAPVKPSINISPAAPKPVINAAPAAASAPTVAAIVPENNDDTKTAAVAKPAAIKPVINIKTTAGVTASDAGNTEDSTVKLKRPARPTATHTNSVVPSITNKPTVTAPVAPEVTTATAAVNTVAPAAATAPSVAAPPSLVKPSAAPTVKLNMNQSVSGVAPVPTQEVPKPKLGFKKAEAAPAPAAEPKAEAPNAEAAKAEPAEEKASVAKASSTGKKAKKGLPADNKKRGKDIVANPDMPPAFHFSIGFLSVIFIFAAVTFCVVQYINTYQPRLFGKYIQIPFMEQVGK